MRYLLDSNVISAFFDNTSIHHNKVVENILDLNDDDELCLSVLTLFEFEYSLFRCSDTKKQTFIRSTIDKLNINFNIIDVSENEAIIFGKIKSLIKDKTGISKENIKKLNIDIMIASSAISNSCITVSGDNTFKIISEIFP